MRARLILLTQLLLLPIWSPPARATMVLPYDLAALTDASTSIALVRVESQESRYTSDGGTIYTVVHCRVLQPLKGAINQGDLITVRREGGEVDGVGMRVIGAARFTDGEEALVFMEPRGEPRGAALYTVGMSQGKLRVAFKDGQKYIVRDHGGLGFVGAAPAEPFIEPLAGVTARITARVTAGVTTSVPGSVPVAPRLPVPVPVPVKGVK